jgi:hypothetical protein
LVFSQVELEVVRLGADLGIDQEYSKFGLENVCGQPSTFGRSILESWIVGSLRLTGVDGSDAVVSPKGHKDHSLVSEIWLEMKNRLGCHPVVLKLTLLLKGLSSIVLAVLNPERHTQELQLDFASWLIGLAGVLEEHLIEAKNLSISRIEIFVRAVSLLS